LLLEPLRKGEGLVQDPEAACLDMPFLTLWESDDGSAAGGPDDRGGSGGVGGQGGDGDEPVLPVPEAFGDLATWAVVLPDLPTVPAEARAPPSAAATAAAAAAAPVPLVLPAVPTDLPSVPAVGGAPADDPTSARLARLNAELRASGAFASDTVRERTAQDEEAEMAALSQLLDLPGPPMHTPTARPRGGRGGGGGGGSGGGGGDLAA
jgi:hypothetical protein